VIIEVPSREIKGKCRGAGKSVGAKGNALGDTLWISFACFWQNRGWPCPGMGSFLQVECEEGWGTADIGGIWPVCGEAVARAGAANLCVGPKGGNQAATKQEHLCRLQAGYGS